MFRKKLSAIAWLGLLLSFLGLSIAYSFQMDFLSYQGVIELSLCVVSGLAAAGQIVTSCYIIRHDPPLRQVLYTCLTGAIVSGVGVLLSGWQMPEIADFVYMVIQGLVYAGVALLYLQVCDCIEPHVIASLNYLIPIIIITFNYFYGLYPMSLLKWSGVHFDVGRSGHRCLFYTCSKQRRGFTFNIKKLVVLSKIIQSFFFYKF